MDFFRRAGVGAGLVLVVSGAVTAPASAEDVAGFYKGKTVAIVMGTGPGGSYDLYGRTIAAHLGDHIPGHPNIIVEHMPGAGGAVAGNYLYGPAPQDGTTILEAHALPLVEKLQGSSKIKFRTREFHWLGAFSAISQVLALWHTVGVKTMDDLKNKDLVIGSFSNTHLTYQWAMLLKNALKTKYKVITGYRGGNALNVAMERGEISGWAASWENLAGTRPQWLQQHTVDIPVAFTLDRLPELPQTPTLLELAPPKMKDVVEFITSGTPIARAMAVGPKVPVDRVAALRRAFDDLMKDQAFLAECKKRKLDISPRDAKAVTALVNKIVSASPDLVTRVKQAVGMTGG